MKTFFSCSQLRHMSPLEVHHLYKLRVDVFVHEQRCAYAEIDDTDADPTTMHVQAHVPGRVRPVATARLFPDSKTALEEKCGSTLSLSEGEYFQLGRLCVDAEFRGQELGAEVLKQTLRLAYETDATRDVVITAQTPLRRYYESFGFTVCGEPFDWDGMEHLPMVRPAGMPAGL